MNKPGYTPAVRRRVATACAVGALLSMASPLEAQFGLDRLLGGGEKGQVYGLDVRDTPSLVFVVDFTIPVEMPGLGDQVQEVVTQEAADYAQRKAVEKGGEVALMAAGPAGTLVRAGLAKRRDRAGRAESHVKAAIKGLSDGQRFGIVYFDGGQPRAWNEALVSADKDERKDADALIDGLYDPQGGGLMSMATMGMSMPGTAPSGGVPPTAGQVLAGIAQAFALGPETIVVILSEAPPDAAVLLDGVAALNAAGSTVIHTAGFIEDGDAGSALRELALSNRGTYLTGEWEEPEEEAAEETGDTEAAGETGN